MVNQLAYLLDCKNDVDKEIEYKIDRALRDIEKEKNKSIKLGDILD
jgi:hypothetical protein